MEYHNNIYMNDCMSPAANIASILLNQPSIRLQGKRPDEVEDNPHREMHFPPYCRQMASARPSPPRSSVYFTFLHRLETH